MKMINLLFLPIIIGVVEGSICCVPLREFTVNQTLYTLSNFGGEQKIVNILTMISFDAVEQRIYSATYNASDPDGGKTETIDDYKTGISYYISNNECSKSATTGWQGMCIPDTVHFVRNSTFGHGGKTIPVQVYEYNEPPDAALMFTVTDDCIPVLQTMQMIASYGVMMETSSMTGFTEEIKNKAVFTPPPICNKES